MEVNQLGSHLKIYLRNHTQIKKSFTNGRESVEEAFTTVYYNLKFLFVIFFF